MSWALRQDPTAGRKGFGPKLLLVVLAEAAWKDGVTVLGRKALAEHCNTDRSATITELYEQLERLGLVKRLERRRENGSRTSDWTILAPLAADRGEMIDATRDSGQIERSQEVVEVARRVVDADNERGTLSGPDEASGESDRGTLSVKVRSAERNGQVRPSVGPYDPKREPKENQTDEVAKATSSSENESTGVASFSSTVIELSHRLADGVLQNDGKAKVKPDDVRWLKPIRGLIDLDGRSVEEIEAVIDWCLADEFNSKTVLSPSKLRERFGELVQKAGVATPARDESPLAVDFRRGTARGARLERPTQRPELASDWLDAHPVTSQLEQLWAPIAEELSKSVDELTYRIWLSSLHLHEVGDELVIGVDSRARAWIDDRFGRLIAGCIEMHVHKPYRFIVCGCDRRERAA